MTSGVSRDPLPVVRRVLDEAARLPGPVADLADDADLFAAGMSSHASVTVMLGLEDAFGVEFPDRMLTKAVFTSVASMVAAVRELTGAGVR